MDSNHGHGTNPTDMPLSTATLRLIAGANDESARLQHEYIGTEHLVLALSGRDDLALPLREMGVEPERVHTRISEIVQRGRVALAPDLNRPFTSRTIKVFSFGAETARALGHAYLDVPHVVVGLLRERVNIGAQALSDAGLTVEQADQYARESGAGDN